MGAGHRFSSLWGSGRSPASLSGMLSLKGIKWPGLWSEKDASDLEPSHFTVLLETGLCFLVTSRIKTRILSMTSMALPFHLSSLISCGDVCYLCIPAHKASWCSMVPCFLCHGVYGLVISLLGIPLTHQNLVTNSTQKSSLVSLVKWSPSIISSVLLHNTHLSFNFKLYCL